MATTTITQTVHSSSDIELQTATSHIGNVSNANSASPDPERIEVEDTPPIDATPALESWNSPPENKYRVFSVFWSFGVIGMNDGSYGVGDTAQRILSCK